MLDIKAAQLVVHLFAIWTSAMLKLQDAQLLNLLKYHFELFSDAEISTGVC